MQTRFTRRQWLAAVGAGAFGAGHAAQASPQKPMRGAFIIMATPYTQSKAVDFEDLAGNAIDTTAAAGGFMMVVLAGSAERERNLVGERTRAALAGKRANRQQTGTVPYGCDLSDDGITLVPNAAEQAVISQIREMRADGKIGRAHV